MRKLIEKLASFNKSLKQKGAVGVLSITGALAGAAGVTGMMYTTDAKIDEASFKNYAKAIAPIVLRSELSLTESNAQELKNFARDNAAEILNRAGIDIDKNAKLKITFGNFSLDDEFEALPEEYATNPRSAKVDEPIKFSAVAIELTRGNAKGEALFGLPGVISDDEDTTGASGTCHCSTRFLSCLTSDIDTTGLPSQVASSIGSPNSATRENYCMYGYTEKHPTAEGYSKYPNFTVFKEAIGHNPKNELTGKYAERFADALANKPLKNVPKENQFPLPKSNVYLAALGYSTAGYSPAPGNNILLGLLGSATDVSGFLYKNGSKMAEKKATLPSAYSNVSLSSYDYSSHTQPGGLFGIGKSKEDWVWPTGYYYVGQVGTCIPGTDETKAPKISAMQKIVDGSSIANSENDPTVNRCLSYKARVDRGEWAFTGGKITLPASIEGYLQTSCVDFNRNQATSVNFRNWLVNSFTWVFTNRQIERSYEALDCTMRNMTWKGVIRSGFFES